MNLRFIVHFAHFKCSKVAFIHCLHVCTPNELVSQRSPRVQCCQRCLEEAANRNDSIDIYLNSIWMLTSLYIDAEMKQRYNGNSGQRHVAQ